eukprot:4183180-Pleurochrysis_carterae.AAC.2
MCAASADRAPRCSSPASVGPALAPALVGPRPVIACPAPPSSPSAVWPPSTGPGLPPRGSWLAPSLAPPSAVARGSAPC